MVRQKTGEVPQAPELIPATAIRAAGLLRPLDYGFLYLDRVLGRVLPVSLNPFAQTGAVAMITLFVATVSGVVLLLWYQPSVNNAYDSVAAMSDAPWTAELLRSLHRYSSDACMFFALVHALRLFFERRFGGARWLGWVTGVATVIVLWVIGWTGYWLVWDTRAQHIAVGTARALDSLPIFADPMGRSFLMDAGVNSLLFFVVFFVHMLIPLAMGIGLWLHLARLSRPKFLTQAPMTTWVMGSLLVLCIAYPAESSGPARMTELSQTFSMDWWYLLPIVLTDRLGGGALWAILLLGGVVLGTLPWSLGRGRPRAAEVAPTRCNACLQCFADCPYEAVSMVPRTDGSRKYPMQAHVDPAKCVGCGICAGSCDSVGIGIDWLPVQDERKQVDQWLGAAAIEGERPNLAFVCGESAGGRLSIDRESGICEELPGYRVLEVPCAGWLHTLSVERALRRGAPDVLIVSCGTGACLYREGTDWLSMRLAGERAPALRSDKVDRDRIHLLPLDRTRKRGLIREAAAIRGSGRSTSESVPGRALSGLAAALLAVVVAGGLGLVSDLGYAAPGVDDSELVVTFKHPGQTSENCRDLTEEEKARRPVHMRKDRICDRRRSSVRLWVTLDGATVLKSSYPPGGVWGDGNSVAVEHLPVSIGEHRIGVAVGDSADPNEWSYTLERTLTFDGSARRVIAFDRLSGFTAH